MIRFDINQNLKEVFEDGKLLAMVYISRQESTPEKISRPLHSHESICELLLVYKGTGTYQVGTSIYPIEEGCVAYYNQGDLHEIATAEKTNIGHYCIGITNLRLKGLKKNQMVPEGGPYIRHAGSLFPFLKTMCDQIYMMEELNPAGQLASQLFCASMVVIASQLDTFPQAMAAETREEEFISRILDYLNEHFTEELNLDKIAEDMHCSATYVSHGLKKATGMTPINYIIRRRIGLAQTMLISTDLTATQIATMVGYDNTNYFSTLFTKTVGMTPIRYRNMYLEKLRGRRDQS